MTSLPTPYPPVWMDVTMRECQQRALATAEHARRLAPLRPTRRGRPAPVVALHQTVGKGLIRLGALLQRSSKGSIGSVETVL